MPTQHSMSLTEEMVVFALVESRGNQSKAAQRLGVSRGTVAAWIKRSEACAEAHHDSLETACDDIEDVLYNKAKKGEGWAVTFFLTGRARRRGYGTTRVEQTGADGGPVTHAEVVIALPDNGRGDSSAPPEEPEA